MTTLTDLPPYQRLKVMERVERIKQGTLKLPGPRCGHCRSTAIEQDPEVFERVRCVACGKSTPKADVRVARKREIQAIIMHGGES